jgi:hypothetical protein
MDGIFQAQWSGIIVVVRCTFGSRDSSDTVILFAASPGTITGVITLSAAHTRLGFPVTALVAVVVASALTWLAMLLVSRVATNPLGVGLHVMRLRASWG